MKKILILFSIFTSLHSIYSQKNIELNFCQKICNKEIIEVVLKDEKLEHNLSKTVENIYKIDRELLENNISEQSLLEMKVKLNNGTIYNFYIDRNDLMICHDFLFCINSINKRKRTFIYDYLSCGSNRFTFQGEIYRVK